MLKPWQPDRRLKVLFQNISLRYVPTDEINGWHHQLHWHSKLAHAQRGVVTWGGGGDRGGAQVGVAMMASAHAQFAGAAIGLVLHSWQTVCLQEDRSPLSLYHIYCFSLWVVDDGCRIGSDLCWDVGCAWVATGPGGGAGGVEGSEGDRVVVRGEDLQVSLLLHLPL